MNQLMDLTEQDAEDGDGAAGQKMEDISLVGKVAS